MQQFDPESLKRLIRPKRNSKGEDNGQVTIIGGSKLFHGAPLLSLKVASRLVDMVFFASPEESLGEVAAQIKSQLLSFIWVPWEEIGDYIEKSDAVLIGPGFLRFISEKVPHHERDQHCDRACQLTKEITEELLKKYSHKRWVIDAGSLQTISPTCLPSQCIVTPNQKEYKLLFGEVDIKEAARKYQCTIVLKGIKTIVCSPEECLEITGGNAGLTKGGTGDVQAGLTAALLSQNEPFLAASAAAYLIKAAAEHLFARVGTNYNADDLADEVPQVLGQLD